jgi:hypothetical protein
VCICGCPSMRTLCTADHNHLVTALWLSTALKVGTRGVLSCTGRLGCPACATLLPCSGTVQSVSARGTRECGMAIVQLCLCLMYPAEGCAEWNAMCLQGANVLNLTMFSNLCRPCFLPQLLLSTPCAAVNRVPCGLPAETRAGRTATSSLSEIRQLQTLIVCGVCALVLACAVLWCTQRKCSH